MRFTAVGLGVVALVFAAACGETSGAPAAPAAPEVPPPLLPYAPEIDAADFVSTIDNPYMPFSPGTRYVYRGVSDGERERGVVVVTRRTKEIMGVACTVVKDVVTAGGNTVEKTFDWFAQDRHGNVWYFGEDSTEYEHGRPASKDGSWEAGVDGALPGIVMLGDPEVGDRYRQEFYEGEAEDLAQVVKLDGSTGVAYGEFDPVLVTRDWTPLEPGVVEKKYYARGVGVVLEIAVKGPASRFELVEFDQP